MKRGMAIYDMLIQCWISFVDTTCLPYCAPFFLFFLNLFLQPPRAHCAENLLQRRNGLNPRRPVVLIPREPRPPVVLIPHEPPDALWY